MEISITSDFQTFLRPICVTTGGHPTPEQLENASRLMEFDRNHVAYSDGKVVGAAGAFSHKLAVPGGIVRAAAVHSVAVLPTHRRKGILSQLEQVQLSDIFRRGEAVAYLWPSEEAIYGRFGYGIACHRTWITMDPKEVRLTNLPEQRGTVTLVDAKNAYDVIAPIYNRVWQTRPGMFFRTEEWWRLRRFADPNLFYAVWEDSAYALYRIELNTSTGYLAGELEVVEAVAESAEGERQIWRYLLAIDLIKTIRVFSLPVDHPLILMLEEPRKLNMQLGQSLWVRIVDVEAALRARASGEGSIVIRVTDDPLLPHNAGIWRVCNEGIERVAMAPQLTVDIAALGSVYLAGFTFAELARAGRITEELPGGIRQADRVFSWDRKPWCPEQF